METSHSVKILVLAPHTDDEAFGCGASIARHVEKGDEVHTIAFSTCGRNELSQEANAASRILGSTLEVGDFPVRRFDEFRQEILDYLIAARERHAPQLVYLPCSFDVHQDHKVIREEGFRAFKHITVLGYELPWNCPSFDTDMFNRVEDRHLEKKVAAIIQYKSQAHRPYFGAAVTEAHLLSRGLQAGCKYAESFEVIRIYA